MMGKHRVLSIVGARPQFIKAAALDRAIAHRAGLVHQILHTGQHYDDQMSKVFFEELSIPRASFDLGVGSGPQGDQTAQMLSGIERVLLNEKPDVVLLYGDTNSTLAGAIAAAKLHLPIAHVEAGLRSFWKHMPEEVNRIVCDHCSTWLFCPTSVAAENLYREGFPRTLQDTPSADHAQVSICGDVMYDNALHFAGLAEQRSTILQDRGLKREGYLLATIHRANNTDDPACLTAIMQALDSAVIKHGLPVVLPMHPRTQARLPNDTLSAAARERIMLLPPVGYLDMIQLERNARLVVTDSGGVQKEAFFYDRPCVVLRDETEWVELVEHGQALLAGADPWRIASAIEHFIVEGKPACSPLYGDGRAAERIMDVLEQALA